MPARARPDLAREHVLVRRLGGAERAGVQAAVSTTSAWRTTTRSSRTPRTASRTQPEMFAAVEPPAPLACPRQDGPAGGRSAGPAERTSVRTPKGTLVAASPVIGASVPGSGHAGRLCCRRTGPANLGSRRPPAAVRCDDEAGPVDALDLELGNQPELPAVAATVVRRVPTEPPAVPAVPEHGPHRVAPGRQQASHVVGVRQMRWRKDVQPGANRSSETRRPFSDTRCTPRAVTWRRVAIGAGTSNARRSTGDGD